MTAENSRTIFGIDHRTGHLVLGGWRLKMPKSRAWRIVIGALLILFGCLGFLPILGFWMVPLGLIVLSHDLAVVRRQRRRLIVWWERRKATKQK